MLALKLIDSVFIGGRLVSILNTVCTKVIVDTISSTTSSIGHLMTVVSNNDKKYIDDIRRSLEHMDLEHKVGVIKELVKEINDDEIGDSTKLALLGINEILEKINNELLVIKKATEYHNSKYFNSWRTFDCSLNIETLEKHKRLLDIRYDILIDLINLHK